MRRDGAAVHRSRGPGCFGPLIRAMSIDKLRQDLLAGLACSTPRDLRAPERPSEGKQPSKGKEWYIYREAPAHAPWCDLANERASLNDPPCKCSPKVAGARGKIHDAADTSESCRPYEPNDRCGGCAECLAMQTTHYGGVVELVRTEHCPRPCSACGGVGGAWSASEVVRSGRWFECAHCDGRGWIIPQLTYKKLDGKATPLPYTVGVDYAIGMDIDCPECDAIGCELCSDGRITLGGTSEAYITTMRRDACDVCGGTGERSMTDMITDMKRMEQCGYCLGKGHNDTVLGIERVK